MVSLGQSRETSEKSTLKEMLKNHDSELERMTESNVEARKRVGKGKKRRRVVVRRPKIVVSKSTLRRPNNSADETKSKKSGAKIPRKKKKATSTRLVKRSKIGKGMRRRRREPKSGEGGAVGSKEDMDGSSWQPTVDEERGGGCYCIHLKEGVRQEGEARGSPSLGGSKCWVCRLREMSRKCKQLRGSRV